MEDKRQLGADYKENIRLIDEILHTSENFDLIKKTLTVGKDELTLYYIDGFVKDAVMSKYMIYLLSLKGLGDSADGTDSEKGMSTRRRAEKFLSAHAPYVEAELSDDLSEMIKFVASGATLMIGSTFGGNAIIIDARTYPARETAEPEGDKVMRGARDGFVETLIGNVDKEKS